MLPWQWGWGPGDGAPASGARCPASGWLGGAGASVWAGAGLDAPATRWGPGTQPVVGGRQDDSAILTHGHGGGAVLGVCTHHSSEPSRGLSLGSPPAARPLSNGSRYHGRSGLRGGPSQSAFAGAVRGPPRGSAAGNGEPSVGLGGSSVGDKRHPHFSAPRGKVCMSGLASKAPEPALWPPRPRWRRLQASWVPRADHPLAPCSPCPALRAPPISLPPRGSSLLPGPPWARLWASARAGLPGGEVRRLSHWPPRAVPSGRGRDDP